MKTTKLYELKKIQAEFPKVKIKGYLIKQEGDKLSGENLSTGHKLNPIFKNFELIKIIIDKLKKRY